MTLIVKGLLVKDYALRGLHVGVYLPVSKMLLSHVFNLPPCHYYPVEGEILDVEKVGGSFESDEAKLKEVIGEKIEFILFTPRLGNNDYLYISEN